MAAHAPPSRRPLPPPLRPLPPPLLVAMLAAVLLTVLAALPAPAAAYTRQRSGGVHCYSEKTCEALCKYGNDYLREKCRRCYPYLCANVPRASTVAPPWPTPTANPWPTPTANRSGRSFPTEPPPPPTYPPTPSPGCIDQNGIVRPPQASWVDDDVYPCMLYTCPKEGGEYSVDDLSVNCVEEPLPELGNCTASRNPGQCCYNYTCHKNPPLVPQSSCVDQDGNPREPDEVWNDDDVYTCVTYLCSNGIIREVKNLTILCKDPPAPHCQRYREVGKCCFSYNCSIIINQTLCRDSGGSYRRDGDTWYDDVAFPCVKYVCRGGVTEVEYNLTDSCKPPPQPNCIAFRPKGACCHNYTCGCDYLGSRREIGEEFFDDDEHPCRLLRCDKSGIVLTVAPLAICEVLNCTSQVRPAGECCPRCEPCAYSGVEYQEGDTFYDDKIRPCRLYRCDGGEVVLERNEADDCPPSPDVHCTAWHMEGLCCPKWDCDEQPCMINDTKHDHGTTWPEDPQKPCKHLICNNSEVQTFSEEAPCEGAPYPHCLERHVPYQCCPEWDCVSTECRYGSDPVQIYAEGQKWYDDPSYPCKQFTCTKAGVVKTRDLTDKCDELEPPDCRTERDLGQCCKRCVPKPPQCFDRSGAPHDPNETFFEDPDTQCVLVRCLHNTTITVYDRRSNCGRDPRLTNPRCSQVATADCCPVYHCPACEYEGRQYRQGDKWWDSDERQCTRYMCGFDGTNTTVFTRLPCPPVRAGCVPNYRGFECCHYKYTCMFDPADNLIPMPQPGTGRSFDFN